MSISSVPTPFRKRSSMLSFESSRHELLTLERSRSRVEPIVTSRNIHAKSATLGRLVSSEGLDLGLPGVYRAKGDNDLIALIPRNKKVIHTAAGGSQFRATKSSDFGDFESFARRYLEEEMIFGENPASDPLPPAKPPRTKVRRSRAKTVDDYLFDPVPVDAVEKDLPPPLMPNACKQLNNNTWSAVGSPPKPPRRPPAPVIEEVDDNVFVERCDSPEKPKRPPIYSTVHKLRRKSKEKILDEPKKVPPPKKTEKFWRTFSDAGKQKQKRREQLKASLSMPFEFRKISLGGMPVTQPIDLIGPHASGSKTVRRTDLYDLPDLPPRRYVQDDADVFKGTQGPDLLSHINTARTRTLSYNPSEMRKLTVSPKSRVSGSNTKKASWFSRHLSHRKSSASDPQAEFLLWNQVEPLDHSLLTRKDSHGSTEDESMENSHIDAKDKKKKEKKKDKKGKPPSRHVSDAKQSDKVRSKLKKFIGRRPTMESLQERGLIQESVFGCPLHKLCDKDGSSIPNFVKLCVDEVERRGLGVDGIYRVSGNLSHVQKLRYNIDRDVPVNLGDNEWEDIHVVTGALKMFLRELPEPVIPFNFFDKFIATCQISDINSRIDATRSLIRALPKPNKETLKYLMQHFVKVVSHSESNRMQVQNVAIVFGPTLLLKPPELTNHHDPGGGHMAVYMMYQNQIVDYMLSEYSKLF